MKINILDKTKKRKFLKELNYLGDLKSKNLFIKTGKEKIRMFSGSLTNEEIIQIWRLFAIEGIGLYFGKEFLNKSGVRDVRLGLDGLHCMKDQITEKKILLTESQEEKWFLGENVEISEKQIKEIGDYKGYVAIVSADGKDLIGVGKLDSSGVVHSFLAKERRRKI
jgi:ribosome biogenesis protein Nip4